MFVALIKVDYLRNRQKYTNILQEIAIQIPTGKIPPFKTAGVSELNKGGNNNHNASACPVEEVHFLMVRSTPDPIRTSSGGVQ